MKTNSRSLRNTLINGSLALGVAVLSSFGTAERVLGQQVIEEPTGTTTTTENPLIAPNPVNPADRLTPNPNQQIVNQPVFNGITSQSQNSLQFEAGYNQTNGNYLKVGGNWAIGSADREKRSSENQREAAKVPIVVEQVRGSTAVSVEIIKGCQNQKEVSFVDCLTKLKTGGVISTFDTSTGFILPVVAPQPKL